MGIVLNLYIAETKPIVKTNPEWNLWFKVKTFWKLKFIMNCDDIVYFCPCHMQERHKLELAPYSKMRSTLIENSYKTWILKQGNYDMYLVDSYFLDGFQEDMTPKLMVAGSSRRVLEQWTSNLGWSNTSWVRHDGWIGRRPAWRWDVVTSWSAIAPMDMKWRARPGHKA